MESSIIAQSAAVLAMGLGASCTFPNRSARVLGHGEDSEVRCYGCKWASEIGRSAIPFYGSNWVDPARSGMSTAGREAAFNCGLAWVVAQIEQRFCQRHTASNDLASLFPKVVNIRRAAILYAIVWGWVTVPPKIVTSATTLLNFMANLGIFLAPNIAISIADYGVAKQRYIQVPAFCPPCRSGPASGSLLVKGYDPLIAQLPLDVSEMLKDCNRRGDYESEEFEMTASVFYARHVCRLDPRPKEVLCAFKGLKKDPTAYLTLQAHSEFVILGSFENREIGQEARKIEAETLLLNGKYDEAPDICMEPWFRGMPEVK
ncbi:hypothetical protein DL768_003741 [Monosporascus sp. mg162]|nr:hypothetical protein DL768_003741 [Monosporascus sp. mg162]